MTPYCPTCGAPEGHSHDLDCPEIIGKLKIPARYATPLSTAPKTETTLKTMNKILLENNEAQPVNMVNVDDQYVSATVARPQSAQTPSTIILRRRPGYANAWDISQVSGPWKGFSLPEGKTDKDIITHNPDGSLTAHYIKSTIPGFDKDRTDALEWALFLQTALNNNQSLAWWPNSIKA